MILLSLSSFRLETDQVQQPPKFLFVDINQQCNLRCKHCMYWMREEQVLPGHISIQRRSEIIAEFAELSPRGTVVICGGESMLNPERYFAVTRQCRELRLGCYSVINGTKVTDQVIAEQLILEGPSEITVSLNSHLPEVHDRSRGVIGSFDMATGAIRLLLAARRRLDIHKPVYAMAVVSELNYRQLDEFYSFVLHDLKADKLKLNFLQPTFGPIHMTNGDEFYRRNIIADYEELGKILEMCDRKYGLNINPEWIRVVKLYHRSVQANGDAAKGWSGKGTEEPICNSYERNLMVNMFGIVRLCFSTNFPGKRLRKRGDLAKFWFGNERVRRKMAKCALYCGISHSVRRVSATMKPLQQPLIPFSLTEMHAHMGKCG
jgi:MoaA/NifB/PqqE/SkfB family radical SAM enzyme